MVVLGAIIVGTFLLYALLTTGIDGPRVHPDEELYTMGCVLARRRRRPHAPR